MFGHDSLVSLFIGPQWIGSQARSSERPELYDQVSDLLSRQIGDPGFDVDTEFSMAPEAGLGGFRRGTHVGVTLGDAAEACVVVGEVFHVAVR